MDPGGVRLDGISSLQRGVRCEPDFRGRIPSMAVGDFANANPALLQRVTLLHVEPVGAGLVVSPGRGAVLRHKDAVGSVERPMAAAPSRSQSGSAIRGGRAAATRRRSAPRSRRGQYEPAQSRKP